MNFHGKTRGATIAVLKLTWVHSRPRLVLRIIPLYGKTHNPKTPKNLRINSNTISSKHSSKFEHSTKNSCKVLSQAFRRTVRVMGIRLPEIILHAKQITHRQVGFEATKHRSPSSDVPKGHFVVYVGEEDEKERKRFVVPLSYLKNPLFQELLSKAAEEFGFEHKLGGITIPCAQDHFVGLTSRLNRPIS